MNIYYIQYKIQQFPKEVKYFFQRLVRGYDDTDLWYLDNFILRKIRKPFKAFLKYQKYKGHGCIPDLFDETNKENPCWRWIEILEQIDEAFDLMWDDYYNMEANYTDGKLDIKKCKVSDKKINRGLNLFAKYFRNLWD